MRLQSKQFDLPGGFLVKTGASTVLYDKILVREMTGEEEDLFTDKAKLQSGDVINDLIASCCTLVQGSSGEKLSLTADMVLDMLSGDRAFVLLKIREVTHGPKYQFSLKCGNKMCEKGNRFEVDLNHIPVTKNPDPLKRVHEFRFEDDDAEDGQTVILFKTMDGHGEKKMAYLREQHPSELFTINLLARTLKINNGKEKEPKFFDFIKKLPKRIRGQYLKACQNVEAGADLSMEKQEVNTCKHCGFVFTGDIPLDDASFLFPEVIS